MKQRNYFLVLIVVLAILGLTNCSKTETSAPLSSDQSVLAGAVLYTPDIAIPSETTDAATGLPNAINPPTSGTDGLGAPPPGQGSPLDRIFRDLKLTKEQMMQIGKFLKQRDDCVKALMLRLRESEKKIYDQANAARIEVMKALKNGDITREQAAQQLKQINERARQALTNNPARLEIQVKLVGCEDTLLENIGSILDETQKAKWDIFVKNYKAQRDKKRPSTGG